MFYFIIKTGYGDEDFIQIDNLDDLEKAQAAFLTNAKVIFKNGQVCRGQDIISIKEDWHREMKWNVTHELNSEDWNDLHKYAIVEKYKGVMNSTKQRVEYLMNNGRLNEIGKNVYIPILEKNKKIADEISKTYDQLNTGFRI